MNRKLSPSVTHPGPWLKRRVLIPANIPVAVAARKLCLSRNSLHALLRAEAAVTPRIALRLEKATGLSAQFWLNMQNNYSLANPEWQKEAECVEPFEN